MNIGLKKRSAPVITAENFFEGTDLFLQKSGMVSFFYYPGLLAPLVRCVDLFWISSSHAAEYKPILEEVERILLEAGLDEEEMKKSAAAGGKTNTGQSRNRR